MKNLAQQVRENRERFTRHERLMHVAKKAKELADTAFAQGEHALGIALMRVVDKAIEMAEKLGR